MPMIEDLTVFFNKDEHGTEAIYQGSTIIGVFEDQFVEVNNIESVHPTFLCDINDVSGVLHGHTLTINAVVYDVKGIQPDGTGLLLMILSDPR